MVKILHTADWQLGKQFKNLGGADTQEEALYWAQDALEVVFTGYMEQNRDIPVPSLPEQDRPSIPISPLKAAKLALYQAMMRMREHGMNQLGLAEKLQCDPRQIRRLLDLDPPFPDGSA